MAVRKVEAHHTAQMRTAGLDDFRAIAGFHTLPFELHCANSFLAFLIDSPKLLRKFITAGHLSRVPELPFSSSK